MAEPNRQLARQLARESLAKGDATGWFDTLYNAASGDESAVPWADMRPNPNLVAWLATRPSAAPTSPRALVVGCGLGDDAEDLAARGFRTTAFDISPRAIDWCRQRFSNTVVEYCVADALALPKQWSRAFDLVIEIYTLQVLPPELRTTAVEQLAGCVAPGGSLLIVARARDVADDRGTMPWPLLREELDVFNQCGLETASFEDFLDRSEDPAVRRFRAEYRRAK